MELDISLYVKILILLPFELILLIVYITSIRQKVTGVVTSMFCSGVPNLAGRIATYNCHLKIDQSFIKYKHDKPIIAITIPEHLHKRINLAFMFHQEIVLYYHKHWFCTPYIYKVSSSPSSEF